MLPLFFWLPDTLHGGAYAFWSFLFLALLFTLAIAIGPLGLAFAAFARRAERGRAAAAV